MFLERQCNVVASSLMFKMRDLRIIRGCPLGENTQLPKKRNDVPLGLGCPRVMPGCDEDQARVLHGVAQRRLS